MKRIKDYGNFSLMIAKNLKINSLDNASEEVIKEFIRVREIAWNYYMMGVLDAADDLAGNASNIRKGIIRQNTVKDF